MVIPKTEIKDSWKDNIPIDRGFLININRAVPVKIKGNGCQDKKCLTIHHQHNIINARNADIGEPMVVI